MERNLQIEIEDQRGGMVEIRFRIPLYIAVWFSKQAKENFKPRNIYIRDIMVQIYRRANNGQQ